MYYHSRSYGNEEVLHIPQNSRNGASPSDSVKCHYQDSHWGGYYFYTETQLMYFTGLYPIYILAYFDILAHTNLWLGFYFRLLKIDGEIQIREI